jgi:hypothetical protein
MSEDQATLILHKYNLLPGLGNRVCYKCGCALKTQVWPDRTVLMCTGQTDGVPCALRRFPAVTAYSPIYNCKCTKREYLLLAHCWSCQKRIDQTHIDTGIKEDRVARMFAIFRDLSGWYVCSSTRDIIFDDGEVDVDAKVTHISRDGTSNVHKGRLFLGAFEGVVSVGCCDYSNIHVNLTEKQQGETCF